MVLRTKAVESNIGQEVAGGKTFRSISPKLEKQISRNLAKVIIRNARKSVGIRKRLAISVEDRTANGKGGIKEYGISVLDSSNVEDAIREGKRIIAWPQVLHVQKIELPDVEGKIVYSVYGREQEVFLRGISAELQCLFDEIKNSQNFIVGRIISGFNMEYAYIDAKGVKIKMREYARKVRAEFNQFNFNFWVSLAGEMDKAAMEMNKYGKEALVESLDLSELPVKFGLGGFEVARSIVSTCGIKFGE